MKYYIGPSGAALAAALSTQVRGLCSCCCSVQPYTVQGPLFLLLFCTALHGSGASALAAALYSPTQVKGRMCQQRVSPLNAFIFLFYPPLQLKINDMHEARLGLFGFERRIKMVALS